MRLIVSALVSLLLLGSSSHPMIAKSTGLLITQEGMARLQNLLERHDPVVTAAYEQLLREASQHLNRDAQPVVGPLQVPRFYRDTQGHRAVARPVRGDSRVAHTLALAYAVSGDERFGQKAKEYLIAWMHSLSHPAHGGDILDWILLHPRADTPIVIGTAFPNFIYAYDLTRDLWQEEESHSFQEWLGQFVRYYLREELFRNNHHNFQSLFLLCAGLVLDDRDLVERAVRYYKRGLSVQIHDQGALPRELLRGAKGSTYTLMALEAMIQFVAVAEDAGYNLRNLRSRRGTNLKDAIDYLVLFLEDPDAWRAGSTRVYPEHRGEWGYILEFPYAWWGDERYLPFMESGPYGHHVRAYTMLHATLQAAVFRGDGL